MAGVVVDASRWIDFFAGQGAEDVDEALAQGAAILPPIVVAELMSGARTARARAAIGELLQDAPVHATPLEHWIEVGSLRQRLAQKGLRVTIPDAHVAQCALERDALLLTGDAVFEQIARHVPLRLPG
ncbi:MAG TPA: PIN domain-containing protein [Thermoanaerobaculia bacterium]|nr:PIN domain-containing protein [Thermoanaerobaculia bacterium]